MPLLLGISYCCTEKGVPDDHFAVHDFYQGYKALRGEYRHELTRKNSRDNTRDVDKADL